MNQLPLPEHFSQVTEADWHWLTEQLGRVPGPVLAVAARDAAGTPQVVMNEPLRRVGKRIEPFPTLYWLSCPRLSRWIARLESEGVIAELEAELVVDEPLAADLLLDHQRYIARRWAVLGEAGQALVEAAGLRGMYQNRGIAGMAHFRCVKCLHAHYAHHLAEGNALGQRLEERYGQPPAA